MVIISIAGDGNVGTGGRFHPLPSDISAGHGRTVTPALQAHSVSSDDLEQWLALLDAGQALVIDASYSAAAVQTQVFKPRPMGSRGLGQLADDKGIRILASSQADDVAIEGGASRHALLLDGIEAGRAGIQPVDKRIDLAEWLVYGTRRVPELYRETGNSRGSAAAGAQTGAGARGAQPSDMTRLGERIAGRPPRQQPELFDLTRRSNSPFLLTWKGR
jgi:hypothetical protein